MNVEEKFTPQTWPELPERQTLDGKNKFIGFWLFLGGETVLFASLFATYLALKDKVPDDSHYLAKDLFSLPLVFVMTMLLLTSSLTSVYAIYHMRNFHFKKMQAWFFITVLLGAGFLALEIYEFNHYVHEFHHTFRSSAFGSAYYTLVGTHGAHVLFGLLWIITLLLRNAKRGLNLYNAPKFYVASLYWHFIDVVWVFIFTVVYLMGKVG
ncbi:MAG: cytochrome (ubi)quinol oxidase subunit III [Caldibacillus debilis]|jgi:cytochrome c oxidase subunit 3|uniref:Cytochrome (Ubi)quinol oxidase subunit III n=1 Tax=Caldibacillus debilis TaxID=301148 RepID=A0A150LQ24_9BACI|nr:cytochrome (ubi)quinol oxidase subunit III [Caldibacillus debilis]MBO2480551.1 cytochrome (ubi)quinol oxidase subunit III [Bacillaceae bacterium]KYD14350.1 Cytochrome c oxidase polypeptide III [Caldibacillus debilis]OUM88489.1 MAG: cytochrome B oxidoreductase [Caldibacillus debilis]REJ15854.1 MAG: cytochrome (ubi)quinol oxidase subunit III [Caldibacillus debilis]REJ26834.1 MAG: cytochrome (ubi)quinol oxidase subunit III [Caldibacillus debilis]